MPCLPDNGGEDELSGWMGAPRLLHWLEETIARPHPDLGREGPICPYVPAAMRHNRLWLAIYPEIDGRSKSAIKATIAGYQRLFCEEAGASARERGPARGSVPEQAQSALLVVFPCLPSEAIGTLEEAMRELKLSFVAAGLMIGEFHPDSLAPGVHNAAFRPMVAPLPLVVVRRLSVHDILFLDKSKPLFEAYRAHFGALYATGREPQRHGLVARYEAAAARFS